MNYSLKHDDNTITSHAASILGMPEELRKFTLANCIACSPYNKYYGGSFYNTTEKSWDYTPDGAIRVSDHWNFWSRGDQHCITDIANEKIEGKWIVAQYYAADGLWHVLSADDKEWTAQEKREQRRANRSFTDPLVKNRENRERVLHEIREKRRKILRAKKIKQQKLWVKCEVNKWRGHGRHIYHAGTETLVGKLIWESKSGKSFDIDCGDYVRQIRKCNSYKELARKPYTKKAAIVCSIAA